MSATHTNGAPRMFTIFAQDDRKVKPTPIAVRGMTRTDVMALSYGAHPAIILNNGRLGAVKVNGALRTWKREPNRVEIPVKYGMYECATLSLDEALHRLVVVI